jgi:hypothetical protein
MFFKSVFSVFLTEAREFSCLVKLKEASILWRSSTPHNRGIRPFIQVIRPRTNRRGGKPKAALIKAAKLVVDIRCGDGAFRGGHDHLVEASNHISRRIEP